MSEKNLYYKIMQLCIKQLTTANTKKGLYKARYVESDPKDENSYKIDRGKIEDHIKALLKRDTYCTYNDIFRRLLISGQNRNMMPSVINFMGKEQLFREALYDLDYTQIANNYREDTDDQQIKLLKELKNKITGIEDKSIDNPKSLWRVYAKFIINAAKFMKDKYPEKNAKYKKTKNTDDIIEYATDVAIDIPGIGFTLACDFLKEIGYDIAKPDLHILAFLKQNYSKKLEDKKTEIKDHLPKNTPLEEAAAVKVMDDIAKKNECDIYALDKLIWLHCSGSYYEKKKDKDDNNGFKGIIVTPKSLQELFLAKI